MQTLNARQLIEQLGIDYFKEGSTFGALSDEAIRYLLEQGQVLQLDKGEQLFAYGDPGNSFYVVLQGSIQFMKPHKNQYTHIRDYVFGQEIGFIAMIGRHERVANTYAAENSIVVQVSAKQFHALHDTMPADFGLLLLNLTREMARRLRESDNKLATHDIHL
ncbi:MAG: cyclic nucleotide-binding domain-containing protein [Amphritea sp.]